MSNNVPTRLAQTLIELVGLPSTPGHEEQVRAYLQERLHGLGLTSQIDQAGNLIAVFPGQGKPILLNAHMDRVPPGLGHTPVLRGDTLYSDGMTNLGADDGAGLAIILELLTRIVEGQLPHPPLVLVFTVEEEVGMRGASLFDPTPWNVSQGIVFDNAFEAGVVVSEGAMYVAFDLEISGRTGHPGKDLAQTVNALEIFRRARYPHGSLHDDQTRILLSKVTAGSARNAVPDSVHIEGELRSFESAEVRQGYLEEIRQGFEEAAAALGGKVTMTAQSHCTSYQVDHDEPLLVLYREMLAERGERLQLRPTFIGSDSASFRPHVKAFTVSTGVANEHSKEEYVSLSPLNRIVEDMLLLLQRLAEA